MGISTVDLLCEFDFLAKEVSVFKKKPKKLKNLRKCLSRAHARNVLKKRQDRALRRYDGKMDLVENPSIHRSRRVVTEVEKSVDSFHANINRIREILIELEQSSISSLVGLLEKYPRREFTKYIVRSIAKYLIPTRNLGLSKVRFDIQRRLGVAISKATSLHLVRQCVAVLIESGKEAVSLVRNSILHVSQGAQRAILSVFARYVKDSQDEKLLSEVFMLAELVCKATNKASTKIAALEVVSLCDYSDKSISVMIGQLKNSKPVVRKYSIDALCHFKRCQRAVSPLLRAFKEERSNANLRILLKTIARVGVSILVSNRVSDITRLSEIFSISPRFEILVSRSIAIHRVSSYPPEIESVTKKLLDFSRELKPMGRLGVLSSVCHGSIGFNISS